MAPAGFDFQAVDVCFASSRVRCTQDFDVTTTSPEDCSLNAVMCPIATVHVPAGTKITTQMLKADAVVLAYQAPFPDNTWERLTLKWPDGSRAKLSIKIATEWSLVTVKSKLLSKTGKPLVGHPFAGKFYICDTYNTDAVCNS
ncbi:hypothetical protein [Actinacidiphila oryziradicis]|uniref:Uncharacterized protein n=1 Tax=Actinacidiphila oryziradicis TaxID=2571141 RepID=A0A4U0T8U6_9ACTN|nr:hypothetical protein [Actinacidiphila oryziradicis]TKA11785.1 hypothetical protein FCI23_10710 [Actinacidiphila oryziradicis]